MKKKILLAILIIVAVGGWYGYKLYSEKTPDLVNKDADIVIDVTKLVAAFDKDTASASKEFMDKIIEVTGNVKSIDTSGAIVLGEQDTQSSVVCGLDRRHMKDHEKIKIGSQATVQGRCTGYEKGEEMLGVSLGTTIQLSFAGVKNKK